MGPRTMFLHTSLWLLCVIVVLKWLITLSILLRVFHRTKSRMSLYLSVNDKLSVMTSSMKCPPPSQIWHHLTVFCSLAGKQYQTNEVISAVEDFSRIRMRASIPQESKRCNTDGSVWTSGETMLKIKPHSVIFNHCIIVSLWTFQPSLYSLWF